LLLQGLGKVREIDCMEFIEPCNAPTGWED
jgi:hypothetical protein